MTRRPETVVLVDGVVVDRGAGVISQPEHSRCWWNGAVEVASMLVEDAQRRGNDEAYFDVFTRSPWPWNRDKQRDHLHNADYIGVDEIRDRWGAARLGATPVAVISATSHLDPDADRRRWWGCGRPDGQEPSCLIVPTSRMTTWLAIMNQAHWLGIPDAALNSVVAPLLAETEAAGPGGRVLLRGGSPIPDDLTFVSAVFHRDHAYSGRAWDTLLRIRRAHPTTTLDAIAVLSHDGYRKSLESEARSFSLLDRTVSWSNATLPDIAASGCIDTASLTSAGRPEQERGAQRIERWLGALAKHGRDTDKGMLVELSYREIAKVMDISPSSVGSRLDTAERRGLLASRAPLIIRRQHMPDLRSSDAGWMTLAAQAARGALADGHHHLADKLLDVISQHG